MSDQPTETIPPEQLQQEKEFADTLNKYRKYIVQRGFKPAFNEHFEDSGEYAEALTNDPEALVGKTVVVLLLDNHPNGNREFCLFMTKVVTIEFGQPLDDEEDFEPKPYALVQLEAPGLKYVWDIGGVASANQDGSCYMMAFQKL